MNNELTLANPCGSLERAVALTAYIQEREREIAQEGGELLAHMNEMTLADQKAAVKGFAKIVEDLRDGGKNLIKMILEDSEALRVIRQIDSRLFTYSTKIDPLSTYGKLANMVKEMKSKVEAEEKKLEAQMPLHTYLARITCTDAGLKKILDAAKKANAQDILVCIPQTDKAVKAAMKLFEENV